MKILVVASESSFRKMQCPAGAEIYPYHPISFKHVESDIPIPVKYDWILFSSRRGVEFFMDTAGRDYISEMKVAVIGSKTSAALNDFGLTPDFVPQRYASSSFFSEFTEHCTVNKGILFPTSDLSGNTLKEQFENSGITFDQISVYITECRKDTLPDVFEAVVFASPSCFDCFLENEGKDVLYDKKLVAIGDKTEAVMKEKGFSPAVPEKFVLESAVKKCMEEK